MWRSERGLVRGGVDAQPNRSTQVVGIGDAMIIWRRQIIGLLCKRSSRLVRFTRDEKEPRRVSPCSLPHDFASRDGPFRSKRHDVGTYPTTDQGLQALISRPQGTERWNGPYLKGEKLPEDPWGHPFVYRFPSQRQGHEYDLYSLGPTGQSGGSGDRAAIYNN